jgi:hypothetical protein
MPEKESPEIRSRVGGRRPGAGRPPGVPNRITRPLKELASQFGPDALQTLVSIMNEGENEQARIAAAKELLDRGYGRPRPEADPKHDSIRVFIYGKDGALSPVVMPHQSADNGDESGHERSTANGNGRQGIPGPY